MAEARAETSVETSPDGWSSRHAVSHTVGWLSIWIPCDCGRRQLYGEVDWMDTPTRFPHQCAV